MYLMKESKRANNGKQTEENVYMMRKLQMINAVLFYGYNILYSDIDVILFMNPFFNIPNKLEYQLLTENVNDDYGTGFMYIQATDGTQEMFKAMQQYLGLLPDKTDWELLRLFISNATFSDVKVKKLSVKFFQEGNVFYKTRQFYGDLYRILFISFLF